METVSIGGGSVVQSLEDAAIPIDDLIDALKSAEADGATHVVGLSGNHRGARWTRLSADWEWIDQ